MRVSRNRARAALALVAAAAVLTACGSDPEPVETPPNVATVPGGGQHFAVGGGTPRRVDYPNPCKLLPTTSAATILQGPVTARHVLTSCFWTPPIASSPVLVLALNDLGSGAIQAYADARRSNKKLKPASVDGIGDAANAYLAKGGLSTVIDVRKGDAYFTVELRTPLGQDAQQLQPRAVVDQVAKLAAAQFTG